MGRNMIDNNSFRSPVIGTDPVSKDTFTIEYASMIWDWDEDIPGAIDKTSRARGSIKIDSFNNPLFKIAKESPLRLQGLVASVDFGIEKRFIKIETISGYKNNDDWNIELNPVTFEILGNLEYLEEIDDYKNQNLL
jgi:hypothetical protein